jgi:predicted aldo/keto reductase-like oxidoreductase
MGVVGMKVLAAGLLTRDASPAELIRYAASQADTVIVGCSTVEQVREDLAVAADFEPMPDAEQRVLEARIAPRANSYDTFKG